MLSDIDMLFQLAPPVVLLLALNVIGLAIKKSPLPDWTIVWVLPLLGGAFYPHIARIVIGTSAAAMPAPESPHQHMFALNVLYGIVIGGASVWGNQLLRQTLDAISSRSANKV